MPKQKNSFQTKGKPQNDGYDSEVNSTDPIEDDDSISSEDIYSEDDDSIPNEGILLSDILDKDVPVNNQKNKNKKSSDLSSTYHDSNQHEEGEDAYEDEEDEEDEDCDDESNSQYDEENGYNNMIAAIDSFTKTNNTEVASNQKSVRFSNQYDLPTNLSSNSQPGMNMGEVSMDTLLGALRKTKGHSQLKRKLEELDNTHQTPVYIEKTTANRIERTLTYDNSKKDMGKWQDFVVSNRNAKTLDLAQDRPKVNTIQSLVTNFEPTTDLEKEINMVLISSELGENDIEKREQEYLESKDLDPVEIAQRQAELAKVKSLLFYEQMKRNRINKIKSKTFHRILKRKKQNAEKREKELFAESELQESVNEEEATKRIKERMTLKHKNTSKWARMALEHGQNNKSLRLI